LGHERDRLLGAARDDDLFGLGRQAAPRIHAGDLAAQRWQSKWQVAGGAVGEWSELGRKASRGRGDFTRPRQGRDRELDRLARQFASGDDREQVARRKRVVGGRCGPREGAAPAQRVDSALGLEAIVGGDDRAPAELERGREVALRGQAGSRRDDSAENRRLERSGEPGEERPPPPLPVH
jgi:hypothetical protein